METKTLFCDACLEWFDHEWDVELMRVDANPQHDEDMHGWRCTNCQTIVLEDGQVVYAE